MYRGICNNSGLEIGKDAALLYALQEIVADKSIFNDFRDKAPLCAKEIEEFFYSGNWIEVREDEE